MAAKNSVSNGSDLVNLVKGATLYGVIGLFLLQGCTSSAEVIVVNEEPKVIVPTLDTEDQRPSSLPREDGILRIGSPFVLRSFDPLYAENPTELRVVSLLYDRLFRLNSAGEPIPYLVDQWQRSEDGKTYTFVLRNDVFYHDSPIFSNGKGRRISAEDVKEVILRTTDPNVPSLGRELLGSIEGLKDMATERFEVKNKTLHIRSLDQPVRVVNSSTLEISLEKPDPRFIYKLASPILSIYPPEALRETAAYLHTMPVGSGPYELSRKQDSVFVVVRTPVQRKDFVNGGEQAVNGEQVVDADTGRLSYTGWNRIDFHWIVDADIAIERLQKGVSGGTVDWFPDAGPILSQHPDKEILSPLGSPGESHGPPPLLRRFNSFVISVYQSLTPAEKPETSIELEAKSSEERDWDASQSLPPIRITDALPLSMRDYCRVELLASDISLNQLDLPHFDSPYLFEWLEFLATESGRTTDPSKNTITIHETFAFVSGMNLMARYRDGYHTQLTSSQTLQESDPTLRNKMKIAELHCSQPALLRKGADFSTIGLENSPVTWRIPNRITP